MEKFLKYLITYIFYPFSFLFKRKKGRLAFGCQRNRFEGNPKYLFIDYSSKGRDACWISADRELVNELRKSGLKAEYTFSLKGMQRALTSEWWFVGAYSSDILFAFSGGAKIFNLWHGVGLKLCEFNITSGPLANRYVKKTLKERFYHPEVFRRPDLMLTASPFQSDMFAPAFRIGKDRCVEKGYPRNSILICEEESRKDFISRYEKTSIHSLIDDLKEFSTVYVYMPTWRDDGKSALNSIDFKRLNEVLLEKHDAMIIKDHFNNKDDGAVREGNIFHVKPSDDIYPILPYTNVLITDYSSVLYDYILMDGKKVLLYLFDYKDYEAERDFFYPFETNVIGQKVYDFESLIRALICGVEPYDEKERKSLLKKFWNGHEKDYDFDNYLHL